MLRVAGRVLYSRFFHLVVQGKDLRHNMEDTGQRGPGIENGSEWSNGTVHFDRTGPTETSGPPRKVHSLLDRNFRKFWLNGLRQNSSEMTGRSEFHTVRAWG